MLMAGSGVRPDAPNPPAKAATSQQPDMIFTETEIPGAFIVDWEPREDSRGFFARAFCAREFEAHGLISAFPQANVAFNRKRGTVRGLHFSVPPSVEAKFVRCVQGSIYDVIVDLRPDSPAYLQWFGVELSAANGRALYVPPMCAHGYQTLSDNAIVFYAHSDFYAPENERGYRADDPAFGIRWPLPFTELSAKDRSWADFV